MRSGLELVLRIAAFDYFFQSMMQHNETDIIFWINDTRQWNVYNFFESIIQHDKTCIKLLYLYYNMMKHIQNYINNYVEYFLNHHWRKKWQSEFFIFHVQKKFKWVQNYYGTKLVVIDFYFVSFSLHWSEIFS